MTWIETVPDEEASGTLRELYRRVRGPDGRIDNILRAHSLRPHTLRGHMTLYKSVLHHAGNRLDKALLETIGVYVSWINGCSYCVEHHFAGLRRLLGDEAGAARIRRALERDDLGGVFDDRQAAALRYAGLLTRAPARIAAADLDELRAAGLDDGEILEVNQVTAYFAYANRTVLGLGVTTDGDTLGLSPGASDDPDNWRHA